jgi:hypothetical protein
MALLGETSAPGATVLLRLEDEAGTVFAEGSVVASAEASGAGRWAAEVYVPGPRHLGRRRQRDPELLRRTHGRRSRRVAPSTPTAERATLLGCERTILPACRSRE